MRPRTSRCALAATLCLASVLLACSADQREARQVKLPPAPTRDLLAEVRAAGATAGDVIEVAPLREAVVEDLLRVAASAEAAGDLTQAEQALVAALKLSPGDPELMQQRAELLLATRQFDDAERLAWRSFELGPRLGGLCRRNWTAVRLAREARGDGAGALKAAEQLRRCLIAPPIRM